MYRKSVLLGALLAVSGGAQAHHSYSMFDRTAPRELAGTVRQFQFTNPHCYIQLVVRNAQGQDEEWSLEMAAPVHLMRLGWNARSLKPGDRIAVTIHPLRNGDRGGHVFTVVGPDGKPIGRQA